MAWRRSTILFGVLLLSALPAAMGQSPKLRSVLPAPTGARAIGRSTFYWKDNARLETSGAAPIARELRVDVWYPAEAGAAAVRAAYCSDFLAIKSRLGFEGAAQGNVETHTLADPPVAKSAAPFPLVLVSPGFGNNANEYTALAEELTSHGYVVATVDHPWQSGAIAYPDGRVIAVKNDEKEIRGNPEKMFESYLNRVDSRVADLRLVLDQLARMNAGEFDARFAGRLDLDRVGALGHSLGGVAAPAACMQDSRFKAAINMDGHTRSLPMLPDERGAGPRQPFLELTDSRTPPRPTDAQLEQWKVTRAEFEGNVEMQQQKYDALMRTIAGGSFRVTVAGATHQSFSDTVLWIAADPQRHFRRTQIIRDYVRAFFDKFLKSEAGTLFDAAKSPYEEVTVERFTAAPKTPG